MKYIFICYLIVGIALGCQTVPQSLPAGTEGGRGKRQNHQRRRKEKEDETPARRGTCEKCSQKTELGIIAEPKTFGRDSEEKEEKVKEINTQIWGFTTLMSFNWYMVLYFCCYVMLNCFLLLGGVIFTLVMVLYVVGRCDFYVSHGTLSLSFPVETFLGFKSKVCCHKNVCGKINLIKGFYAHHIFSL
jgi:hypothetical protein